MYITNVHKRTMQVSNDGATARSCVITSSLLVKFIDLGNEWLFSMLGLDGYL